MKQHLYALLIVLFAASACSNENLITETVNEPNNNTELFRAVAAMPEGTPATRLGFQEKGDKGSEYLEVTWKDAYDKFSVFAGADATKSTPLTWESNDETNKKAVFAGNMKPESGTKYYAFYPVTTSTDPTSVTLDMSGQNGTLKSEKMFMYSGESELKKQELLFSFNHLTAVLKVTLEFKKDVIKGDNGLKLDAGGVVSRMAKDDPVKEIRFTAGDLLTGGTVDITDGSVKDPKEGNIFLTDNPETVLSESGDTYTTTFYLHLLPATLTNLIVRVKVGNGYYEGFISEKAKIEKKKYYTTNPIEMRKIEVGDLMLTSGKTIDPDEYAAVKESDPAIGVVAYLYQDETTDYPTHQKQIVTLSDDGPAKGLVMALKNASTNCLWSLFEDTTLGDEYLISDQIQFCNSYNGYFLKSKVDEAANKEEFTAVNTAADYGNTVAAPANTSGWYLPSQGEWMLMLSKDGIGACQDVNDNVMTGNYILTNTDPIVDNLNKALTSAGENNYDSFAATESRYWSSNEYINLYSEYGSNDACVVYFDTKGIMFSMCTKNDEWNVYWVRSILAF